MLLLSIVALFVGKAVAANIQVSGNQMWQTTDLDELFNSNVSSEVPEISSNASALNAKMFIECDGSSYGYNLNLAACEQINGFITFESKQRTWGERHTAAFQKAKMFPLPFMMMDSKLPKVRSLYVVFEKYFPVSYFIDKLNRQSDMLFPDGVSRRPN